MGARVSSWRAAWPLIVALLALPAACGGRSTTLGTDNPAGEGSGAWSGSSAAGAPGAGATGGTGAAGATGLGGDAASTGGAVASGGINARCIEPSLSDRRCQTDADCAVFAPGSCCTVAFANGVNVAAMCPQDVVACEGDCSGPKWITDTTERTSDITDIKVRCEFGEPGAGVCLSYVDLDPPYQSRECGGLTCAAEELCVHEARRGPLEPCLPFLDGGACPEGTELGTCADTGGPGCAPFPRPPPPHCVRSGESCGDSATCDCLPKDICGLTACAEVLGRDVRCAGLPR